MYVPVKAIEVFIWGRRVGVLTHDYDLTGYHFSVEDKDFEAWSNPHALSVNGKTGLITDDDLLLVAERFGIGTAKRALKEIEEGLKG